MVQLLYPAPMRWLVWVSCIRLWSAVMQGAFLFIPARSRRASAADKVIADIRMNTPGPKASMRPSARRARVRISSRAARSSAALMPRRSGGW